MALVSTQQNDWGGGIYRGRDAPANGFYDAVNALVDDEGHLYRRGGSAYWSTSDAGSTLFRIVNAYFPGPQTGRVIAWGASGLYAFDGSKAPVTISSLSGAFDRPVFVGGVLVYPSTVGGSIFLYGGSLLPAGGYDGSSSLTVTNGSTAVTKAGGTTFVGNIDAGMILRPSGGTAQDYAVVRSVDGANALTLVNAWGGSTSTSTSFEILALASLSTGADVPENHLGAAGSPARLLLGGGNRVYLTTSGSATAVDEDTYHELPAGTSLRGIQGIGDRALVFGTSGAWAIDNLNLDVVDDYGNIQQSVGLVNGDVALWHEAGLMPYAGGAIVPAVDDIHLITAGGDAKPITGAPDNERVRRLYRSYVKTAGRLPGFGAVHRGHLFMPILDGATLVDTLVCRLDRGAAWTRWDGHGAAAGFAVRPGTDSAAAVLLGTKSERVTDLSSTFDPTSSNSQDADGTSHVATITTRDYPMGDPPSIVQRANMTFELTEDGTNTAPTVALAYSSDADDDSFTTLTEKGVRGSTGTGGTTSDGSAYHWCRVGKRRNRIRFKITTSGAAASFVLRSLELLVRPTGKS